MTKAALTEQAVRQILTEARTHVAWQDEPVPDDLLVNVYEAAKFGPTGANCCPLRVVFVKSPAAKEKLKPALAPGNVEKTMTAPATAIFAYDLKFYDFLPRLFPHTDARSWYVGNEALAQSTAVLNGSLQAAYFIIAARAFGLDCGPMGGFDKSKVDEAFFAGTSWKSNFLCNLGFGDESKLHPRGPRLTFEEACKII